MSDLWHPLLKNSRGMRKFSASFGAFIRSRYCPTNCYRAELVSLFHTTGLVTEIAQTAISEVMAVPWRRLPQRAQQTHEPRVINLGRSLF